MCRDIADIGVESTQPCCQYASVERSSPLAGKRDEARMRKHEYFVYQMPSRGPMTDGTLAQHVHAQGQKVFAMSRRPSRAPDQVAEEENHGREWNFMRATNFEATRRRSAFGSLTPR